MTVHAAVLIRIPGSATLDAREELIEKVRETAHPVLGADGRSLLIDWEQENMWDLRGNVQATFEDIECWDFRIDLPDLDEPGDGSDTNLARFQVWEGDQPMQEKSE